jgi:hypothetical protein
MQCILLNEQLFPVVDAIAKVTGRKVHATTAVRWATPKENEPSLETVMCGGRRMTSPNAVCRYFEALTEHRTLGTKS